jgi:PIN domain nuclease of toxin-antitoxin system
VRVLLDTHALLRWSLADGRLSRRAGDIVSDGSNDVFLSAASVWELAIKYSKGRLELPDPPERLIPVIIRDDGLIPLSVEMDHSLRVCTLPRLHNDPFDRLLVAQAQVEGLPILTPDANIARYDIEVIW